MRWSWRRRRTHGPTADAHADASQAHKALADARNLDGKVDRVAAELSERLRVNHIAQSVIKSIQRG